MSKMTTSSKKIVETTSRIPCRGCVADCMFISKCEGKLWRMTDLTTAACLEAGRDKQANS